MLDTEKVWRLSDLKPGAEFAKFPLAVFGFPIAHSQSPKMQNAALRELAKSDSKFRGWAYYKFEVAPEELKDTLKAFHDLGFLGVNLTIPHKEIVLDFLEGAEDFAVMARAANTLKRTPTGWKGFNTDGFGLAKAVELFCGRAFRGSDVVIFGAGGAARAAAFKAAMDGCKSLRVFNRTKSRLDSLLESLRGAGFSAGSLGGVGEIKAGSILINATSVGLKKDDLPIVDFSAIDKSCAFFDMPYRAGGETPSVEAARKAGLKAASGRAMLAWQGAKSLSIWTGREMLGELMLNALDSDT